MARYQGTEVDPLNPPEGAVHANRTNLLLLGTTGTGKSTTGNSILQRQGFKTSNFGSSETTECKADFARDNQNVIKVVDMPGLANAAMNEEQDVKHVVGAAMDAIAETPKGYHAVLVVTKYGRQTRDNIMAVDQLKDMFGQNIFKQYGILIITYGDEFRRNNDNNKTIKEYCSEQKGPIYELWKECNERVVLFNNVSEVPEEKASQRRELLDIVERMKKTKRYTPELFEAAKASRDELIRRAEMAVLTETMKCTLRLLMCDLFDVNIDILDRPDDGMVHLLQLVQIEKRVEMLKEEINVRFAKLKTKTKIPDMAISIGSCVKMKQDLVHIIITYQAKAEVRRNMLAKIAQSDRDSFQTSWKKDNDSAEEEIRKMKEQIAATQAKFDEQYQTLLEKEGTKKEIMKSVAKYIIRASSHAAVAVAFGGGAPGIAAAAAAGAFARPLAATGLRFTISGLQALERLINN